MAYNHVIPYVLRGVPGWRVSWRVPLAVPTVTSTKSNTVSTKRFPIANGVTAEQAWQDAVKFAARMYGRGGFVVIPEMPEVDWKKLGATTGITYTQRYANKTEHAEKLYRAGYDPVRISSEVGCSISSVYRWKKSWD